MELRSVKRLTSLAGSALLFALLATAGNTQEWTHYQGFDDRFSVDFPTDPSIETATYLTEYGINLPSRIYTAEDRFGTYSVTAVNWGEAEASHASAYEECQTDTGDLRGGDNPGHCSSIYYAREIRGAALDAAFRLMKPGSEVLHLGYTFAERVEGVGVQLLLEDGSRSFSVIFWHDYYLYIAEAVAPAGMPPPLLFSTSLGFLDEEGNRITYGGRYSPLDPVPARTR